MNPPFSRGLAFTRQPRQATGLVPRGGLTVAGQCRAHTGLRWAAAVPAVPGTNSNVHNGRNTVKARLAGLKTVTAVQIADRAATTW